MSVLKSLIQCCVVRVRERERKKVSERQRRGTSTETHLLIPNSHFLKVLKEFKKILSKPVAT
jgi:hypothetical protein